MFFEILCVFNKISKWLSSNNFIRIIRIPPLYLALLVLCVFVMVQSNLINSGVAKV